MWHALVRTAKRWLEEWKKPLGRVRELAQPSLPAAHHRHFQPLQRILLTDGVGRTLFEEYAAHRRSSRGEEEIGWMLLGLREKTEGIALATLPAGTQREAGIAHVRFDSTAQALASRIVRQQERRLCILGVVHTHPGSLRHPSDADYRGDIGWVAQLRGGEGVFGIGTADGQSVKGDGVARQPRANVQCLGDLRFSWYSLARKDRQYRRLPVGLTLGPDLAQSLRPVWPTIEIHAERLDRLARQQAGLRFDLVSHKMGTALAASIPLAEPGHFLRVLLDGEDIAYFLVRGDSVLTADPKECRVDRGVYLMLAELAAQ